jgi:hypothetical protein
MDLLKQYVQINLRCAHEAFVFLKEYIKLLILVTITFYFNSFHLCCLSMLYCLLRLNSIVPCINLFIYLLISYLFCIFLNEANKCSHASGDMGSTIIKIFCGFCLNARFLHIIAQIFAPYAAAPSLCSIASQCLTF